MLLVTVAAIILTPASYATAPHTSYTPPDEEIINETTEVPLPAVLKRIAHCESGDRQFNPDGTVLRGRQNPKDVGRFQINETYHLAQSLALGVDIYTWEGNTAYALWLHEHQGTQPWTWSKPCWYN